MFWMCYILKRGAVLCYYMSYPLRDEMFADVQRRFDGVGVHSYRFVVVCDAFVDELLLEVHVLWIHWEMENIHIYRFDTNYIYIFIFLSYM